MSQHCWAQHVACVWPPCCDELRHVGCCWLKFESGQIWANNTQHVATYRNTVAKRTYHVAPNNLAICCVDMLRSFGRGFRKLCHLLIFYPKFCTLFNSFGLVVSKWVLELNLSSEIYNYDNSPSRVYIMQRSRKRLCFHVEQTVTCRREKLPVHCSQLTFWLVTFLLGGPNRVNVAL